MKKFLLTAMAVVLTLGASALTRPVQKQAQMQVKPTTQLANLNLNQKALSTPVKMDNIKKAPKALQNKMMERYANKLCSKAQAFPVTTFDDLTGTYTYSYTQYHSNLTTQPDTLDVSLLYNYTENVGIRYVGNNKIRITGMTPFTITATVDTLSNGLKYFAIDEDQIIYIHSSYGELGLEGLFYYEGDETNPADWYLTNIVGYILDDGILMDPNVHTDWYIMNGDYAGYALTYPTAGGANLIPSEEYNGLMTYESYVNDTVYFTVDNPIIISEDESYQVTIQNFGGLANQNVNPVKLDLGAYRMFTAPDNQLLFTYNKTYNLYLMNLIPDEDGESFTCDYNITGYGTDTELMFEGYIADYDPDNSALWDYYFYPTIELTDGSTFTWPDADVYVMGNLAENDNTWATNKGVKLTIDGNELGAIYTGEFEFTQSAAQGDLKSFFGFTTALAETADDWSGIAPYRFGAETDQYWVTDKMMGTDLETVDGGNSFAVTPGTYKIELLMPDKIFSIDKVAVDDVYILGNIDENEGLWEPNKGFKMTPDEDGVVYTAEININNEGGNGVFNFTKKLGENWDVITPYRFGYDGNDDEHPVTSFPTTLNMTQDAAGWNSIKLNNGKYTLELNIEERTLKIDAIYDYKLHYGLAGTTEGWQDVTFVAGEGENEGKLVAANVVFAENTAFGVMYGPTWYAGNVGDSGDLYYGIHKDWCTDIPLVNEGNIKDFCITDAGKYTFIITEGENGLFLTVTGWPVPLVGDVDLDGKVDVSDVNIVVNIILGKDSAANYDGRADVKQNGAVDVSDVNAIVNIILGKVEE